MGRGRWAPPQSGWRSAAALSVAAGPEYWAAPVTARFTAGRANDGQENLQECGCFMRTFDAPPRPAGLQQG
jgi:hypothetical protein